MIIYIVHSPGSPIARNIWYCLFLKREDHGQHHAFNQHYGKQIHENINNLLRFSISWVVCLSFKRLKLDLHISFTSYKTCFHFVRINHKQPECETIRPFQWLTAKKLVNRKLVKWVIIQCVSSFFKLRQNMLISSFSSLLLIWIVVQYLTFH